MGASDILAIIAIILIGILGLFFVPTWMVKRSMNKVVSIFIEKGATGMDNARTIDELGLRPKGFLERIGGPRDWKPKALEMLIQAKVVMMTDEGKLYVTQASLDAAKWLKIRRL